ncbi:MAG: putative toxin-antitoxin system toxin component, PIN family [Thermomicrobiales bacterium]|nr:putative toxin-antitoxin system toxin component, PIN family [Thermomicrobiales bacterium]
MKVLLDANVLISILLAKSGESPIVTIAHALSIGLFTPVVSEATVREMAHAVQQKPYLARRIEPEKMDDFINMLKLANGIVPSTNAAPELVLRDARDDYLILTARQHRVDMLVSGDEDVLAHAGNEPFAILSPPAFVAALKELAEE